MKSIKYVLITVFMLLFVSAASAAQYEGIDVSVWQGTIDFEAVRASGKEVVYIRAGYGMSEDPDFRTNAYSANAAGLSVGYYFFVTATDSAQAAVQAQYFASLISTATYNCRPAVDFEEFGNLTSAQINTIALTFAETLENETNQTPLFYTDAYNAQNLWTEALTAYPLWVADYGVDAPYSTGDWETWAGFQYSDVGDVAGITGDVDLDIFTDAVFLDNNPSLPFTDVLNDEWFYGSVCALYNDKLINGTSPTLFSPYSAAERAAFVTLLYRLDGSPSVSDAPDFSDVTGGEWYSSAVSWAQNASIAKGYGNNEFAPLSAVTRQEAALFLYRYALYKGYDIGARGSLGAYSDGGDVAPWAETALKWAVGTKIIRGTAIDELAAKSTIDRADMAVMLARFIAIYQP